jgi:hypothetical protein
MIDLPDNDVVAGLKMKLDKLNSDSQTALTERMERDKALLESSHDRGDFLGPWLYTISSGV